VGGGKQTRWKMKRWHRSMIGVDSMHLKQMPRRNQDPERMAAHVTNYYDVDDVVGAGDFVCHLNVNALLNLMNSVYDASLFVVGPGPGPDPASFVLCGFHLHPDLDLFVDAS